MCFNIIFGSVFTVTYFKKSFKIKHTYIVNAGKKGKTMALKCFFLFTFCFEVQFYFLNTSCYSSAAQVFKQISSWISAIFPFWQSDVYSRKTVCKTGVPLAA